MILLNLWIEWAWFSYTGGALCNKLDMDFLTKYRVVINFELGEINLKGCTKYMLQHLSSRSSLARTLAWLQKTFLLLKWNSSEPPQTQYNMTTSKAIFKVLINNIMYNSFLSSWYRVAFLLAVYVICWQGMSSRDVVLRRNGQVTMPSAHWWI